MSPRLAALGGLLSSAAVRLRRAAGRRWSLRLRRAAVRLRRVAARLRRAATCLRLRRAAVRLRRAADLWLARRRCAWAFAASPRRHRRLCSAWALAALLCIWPVASSSNLCAAWAPVRAPYSCTARTTVVDSPGCLYCKKRIQRHIRNNVIANNKIKNSGHTASGGWIEPTINI